VREKSILTDMPCVEVNVWSRDIGSCSINMKPGKVLNLYVLIPTLLHTYLKVVDVT
jgi:hypothetical protein